MLALVVAEILLPNVLWFASRHVLLVSSLALLGLALIWLLTRLHAAALRLLGLMPSATGPGRQGLDELVLASRLTERELVLGAWWSSMRRLLVPLAAVAICATLAQGVALHYNVERTVHAQWRSNFPEVSDAPLYAVLEAYRNQALLTALKLATRGALAAGILCFALIALSTPRRGGVLPMAGASLLVLWQLAFAWVSLPYAQRDWNGYLQTYWWHWLMPPLLFFIALFMARRLDWLATALATGLPLFVYLGLVLALPGSSPDFGAYFARELFHNNWLLNCTAILDADALGVEHWRSLSSIWHYVSSSRTCLTLNCF